MDLANLFGKIIIVATDRENKKIVWVVVDENKILLYNF